MKYRILKNYIAYCNDNSLTPSCIGLNEHRIELESQEVVIEWLRADLNRFIEMFGTSNSRTVAKSQELDRELNKKVIPFQRNHTA